VASLKLETPWRRSSQTVGSSVTGGRARRASATSSTPISMLAVDATPTSGMKDAS